LIPEVKPYVAPILKRKRAVHLGFLTLLDDEKLFTWRHRSRCEAGLFFVAEKEQGQIRMVVDARAANRVVRPPSGVVLTTVETLALTHTDETQNLYASKGDVSNCLYR
jgi:hypothetical protein